MTDPRPYELLARFNADGTVAGVSVRTLTTVNGRDFEGDPVPLAGATDPVFITFADQFSAAVVAERDAALEALEAQRIDMQAEINRLTALVPPEEDPNGIPSVITCVQGRLALLQAGLLDAVESSIKSATREVQIFWEFATEWHRSNAVLISLGTTLGLSEPQVDDLFRIAKGL